MSITAKQKKFCEEYMVDLNAKQAAIRSGYSNNTAVAQASRLLVNVNVQNYIKRLKTKAAEVLEITTQQMLRRLKNWIDSDITETIGLSPVEVQMLPIQVRRLITSYKHKIKRYPNPGKPDTVVEEIELKFVSKERAVEMVNKHIGFYDEDNRQKAPVLDMSNLSTDVLKELATLTGEKQ